MTSPHCALPRITIITSTFNCENDLKKTADSIRQQTYKNIQWIVADGASTDGTIDVIKANQDIVTNWFSEPDSGIYDAWNKACKLIDGEWVFFLGAGDLLFSSSTLLSCANIFKTTPNCRTILYGDVHLLDKHGRTIGVYGRLSKKWECNRPALPPHQGTFQRNSLFHTHPVFDSQLKIAADSKFLLGALEKTAPIYLGFPISKMDSYGVSSNPKNALAALQEINSICITMGISPPLMHKIKIYTLCHMKIILFFIFPKKIMTIVTKTKRFFLGLR